MASKVVPMRVQVLTAGKRAATADKTESAGDEDSIPPAASCGSVEFPRIDIAAKEGGDGRRRGARMRPFKESVGERKGGQVYSSVAARDELNSSLGPARAGTPFGREIGRW